jgi:hypothetical protein
MSAVILAACLAAAASAESFRLFFDSAGNGGSNAGPHPGGLSYGNPATLPGGSRLYIYGQFLGNGPIGAGQVVERLNIDITTDDGIITGALNFSGPGQDDLTGDRRWDEAAPNPVVNPNQRTVSFTAYNVTHLGLENGSYHDLFDVQHDDRNGFGDTLLGYVDIEGSGNCGVWFSIGEGGIQIRGGGPNDEIFFGFGDDPVRAGDIGRRSDLRDAGTLAPCCDPCDANCDLGVDAFDIEPFIELLVNPSAAPCAPCTGDTNGDGVVDAFDIEPFIDCLLAP